MIKKVKLSDYLASAPIQENLKTFTGIDANNALGLMTPERLAAVAEELICRDIVKKGTISANPGEPFQIDFPTGILFMFNEGAQYGDLFYIDYWSNVVERKTFTASSYITSVKKEARKKTITFEVNSKCSLYYIFIGPF